MPVRIGSGITAGPDPAAAIDAAAAGLDGAACDLCVVFASGAHLESAPGVLAAIHERLRPSQLVGCGAGGVLGGRREIERGTGLAVWAASLGGGTTVATHVTDGAGDLEGADGAILIADPRRFDPETVLAALPQIPVVGGLASTSVLFHDDQVVNGGHLAVRFDGVAIAACVSQGAVPVGPELTITACEGNVIHELAGQPAYTKLRWVAAGLSDAEQALLERSGSVLLGIVVDPNKPDYVQGDFLVRPLIGGDPRTGAVAVGALLRPGQVVRLHARDAISAARDLPVALETGRRALGAEPAGALAFVCNGRGAALLGPDADATAVDTTLGGVPSAGFFAAGEIGPVGTETFMHGFTATVALFGQDLRA
jgi:small ligand-binding sensory domain FIST